MESGLIEIVLFRIHEKYSSEREFYQGIHLTQEEWEEWKRGTLRLDKRIITEMIRLFSDYEWMLVQKVLRQVKVIPEKENTALLEYRRMSVAIATKWLQSDLANVELVEQISNESNFSKMIEVRVGMRYDAWGYGDILSFTFPSIERERVSGSRRALIQLIDEKYN